MCVSDRPHSGSSNSGQAGPILPDEDLLLRPCGLTATSFEITAGTVTIWNRSNRESKRSEAGPGHGGTSAGEQAWLCQKHLLPLELSPESIRLQQAIKRTFDPNFILNPGKVFCW